MKRRVYQQILKILREIDELASESDYGVLSKINDLNNLILKSYVNDHFTKSWVKNFWDDHFFLATAITLLMIILPVLVILIIFKT